MVLGTLLWIIVVIVIIIVIVAVLKFLFQVFLLVPIGENYFYDFSYAKELLMISNA